MFTEIDYKKYFTALKETDEQMLANTEKLLLKITDPSIRKISSAIRNDELYHLKLIDELFEICY